MPKEQVFTLEAINELLPKLNLLVGRQLARRADIESRIRQLKERTGAVPDTIVIDDADDEPTRDLKIDIIKRLEEYHSTWRSIEDMGAVLKDARAGLLDFYGRVDGQLVWLCWRFGETEITHYHALDEGFTGRRELRMSAKHRLIN